MRKHAVVPPFHALDPELRVAERLLRRGNPELSGIVARLPDDKRPRGRPGSRNS
ncbi:hypothetical protein [Amycolatopsis sp. cmx-8-4]|uniref:hypothetical protein n=1 Tax=Amycolatopsis sp. cmx-8-4 TaxID=2790947 RepID=UPI00397B9AB1